MSLYNTALWGSVLPGGVPGEAAAGGIDSTEVIDRLLPALHSADRASLTFWAEADLIQWLDEAVKRLASLASVFVGRDVGTLTVTAQTQYALPPGHLSTLHVSLNQTPLSPSNGQELEARDSLYLTAPGTPDSWYEDRMPQANFGLAPVPVAPAGDTVAVIYNGWPVALDAGKQQTLVAAPAPVKFYLAMATLAEAYSKEGEAEAPEVADFCRAQMKVFEQALQAYYGSGV